MYDGSNETTLLLMGSSGQPMGSVKATKKAEPPYIGRAQKLVETGSRSTIE